MHACVDGLSDTNTCSLNCAPSEGSGVAMAFRILFRTKVKAFGEPTVRSSRCAEARRFRKPRPSPAQPPPKPPIPIHPLPTATPSGGPSVLLFVIIADTILFCFSIARNPIMAVYDRPDSGKRTACVLLIINAGCIYLLRRPRDPCGLAAQKTRSERQGERQRQKKRRKQKKKKTKSQTNK